MASCCPGPVRSGFGVTVLAALAPGLGRPLGVIGKIAGMVFCALVAGLRGFSRFMARAAVAVLATLAARLGSAFGVTGKVARTVLAPLMPGLGRFCAVIGEIAGIMRGTATPAAIGRSQGDTVMQGDMRIHDLHLSLAAATGDPCFSPVPSRGMTEEAIPGTPAVKGSTMHPFPGCGRVA